MNDLLLAIALLSLALGALSGFAVLTCVDYPEKARALGVINPMRIRQAHIDWIVMGTVMVSTALAVPDMPGWIYALVMFGGVVNPLTFVPMAFSKTVDTTQAFRLVSLVSFTSLSLGLVLAAGHFISTHF
ncbi:hydroxylaminobenzene mutase [Pseudomonas sp. AG1028]|uniref:hypothetical protein n=1 Tax=unclassified Pseudomonas TaxID=196821 RepID=UPI0004889EC8|nr:MULTISPECIES: hypothetical protein [unclassified Pseudomonas]PZW65357.1 hydroxylaminobenzene mutase [Pseudomonas sp. URMO17WK12:I1]TWE02838.1 hydroxylaminobenzene mutase [Pseudomonas sp. AG1028]